MDHEMIEKALVAASIAKADGHNATSDALIEIAKLIKLVGPPHPHKPFDLTSAESNR